MLEEVVSRNTCLVWINHYALAFLVMDSSLCDGLLGMDLSLYYVCLVWIKHYVMVCVVWIHHYVMAFLGIDLLLSDSLLGIMHHWVYNPRPLF